MEFGDKEHVKRIASMEKGAEITAEDARAMYREVRSYDPWENGRQVSIKQLQRESASLYQRCDDMCQMKLGLEWNNAEHERTAEAAYERAINQRRCQLQQRAAALSLAARFLLWDETEWEIF